ncbi:platelet-activating factor acetylhydrolase, isoform II-domain-containing protein [Hyaloraphidium curvatum]|nr:platelet-activating factor acetylhydrolase, isoform II-domain-containing protein [Hyaloraphidium curvatum]
MGDSSMPSATSPSLLSRLVGSAARLFTPNLPAYPGPHEVAVRDHEHIASRRCAAADAPRPESVPATATDAALWTSAIHPVEGFSVRLFYPTKPTPGAKRAGWLPDPPGLYGGGYGSFIGVPASLAAAAFRSLFALTWTWDWVSTPLAPPANGMDKLPVIVFSHGLGGCRSTYSYFCGTLASYGFVVAALEHSDSSACATAIDSGRYPIHYRRPPFKLEDAAEWEKARLFRSSQLAFRTDQVGQCLDFLEKLDAGTYDGGLAATGGQAADAFDWSQFKGRLDVSNAAMAGHSFGAATALNVLGSPLLGSRFRCGILLDAWMFAVPADTRLSVPLLSLNSSSFHWRANLVRLHALFPHLMPGSPMPAQERDSAFLTFPDTAHQNASDLPLLLPTLIRATGMAGKADPVKAARAQNRAALGFLRLRLGSEVARGLVPKEYEGYLVGETLDGDAVLVAGEGDAVLPLPEAEKRDKEEEDKEGRGMDRIDEETDEQKGEEAQNGTAVQANGSPRL